MIGVGVIGTGFGLRAVKPAFERTGGAKVVAVCGSSQQRADQLGAEHGIAMRTDDPLRLVESANVDLVVVASPNDLHLEHARRVLEAGKHLWLEKPVGLDAAEARQLARLAAKSPGLVVVDHPLRFDPEVRRFESLVASGAIGRPYFATVSQRSSSLASSAHPRTWQHDRARGGGVRLGTGSHLLDLLRFLLKEEAVAITGIVDPVHAGADADAFFAASVTYTGGLMAHVVAAPAAHVASAFDFAVHGDEGALTFDLDRRLGLHRRGRAEIQADSGVASPFLNGLGYLAAGVVDALATGRSSVEPAATLDDAVRCMEQLDAALESSVSGRTAEVTR